MSNVVPAAPSPAAPGEPTRIERFYHRLLALDGPAELEPALDDALRLLVELAAAQLAYLELLGPARRGPYWRGYATGPASASPIRARVSHGIVARAIAEQRPIETTSAISDARFAELASVRQNDIAAVSCVPIGTHAAAGALYLQSSRALSPGDRHRLALLARQLHPIAPWLVRGASASRPKLRDELRELQRRRVHEALLRHDGNIARAARELGVGRMFVYRIARGTPGVSPADPEGDS